MKKILSILTLASLSYITFAFVCSKLIEPYHFLVKILFVPFMIGLIIGLFIRNKKDMYIIFPLAVFIKYLFFWIRSFAYFSQDTIESLYIMIGSFVTYGLIEIGFSLLSSNIAHIYKRRH